MRKVLLEEAHTWGGEAKEKKAVYWKVKITRSSLRQD